MSPHLIPALKPPSYLVGVDDHLAPCSPLPKPCSDDAGGDLPTVVVEQATLDLTELVACFPDGIRPGIDQGADIGMKRPIGVEGGPALGIAHHGGGRIGAVQDAPDQPGQEVVGMRPDLGAFPLPDGLDIDAEERRHGSQALLALLFCPSPMQLPALAIAILDHGRGSGVGV